MLQDCLSLFSFQLAWDVIAFSSVPIRSCMMRRCITDIRVAILTSVC
eukprot:COSAG05_NODE_865_length_6876_cov_357.169396_3_plen_47_part_00